MLNRVLIVEDSKSLQALITSHISNVDGIEVVTASCYEECKTILSASDDGQHLLCAVLDLNLPDAPDGEVVTLVQEHEIPIIILTASVDKAVKKTMNNHLIVEYVVKRGIKEIEYVARKISYLYNNQTQKVMVVEDSPSFNLYLQTLLAHYRYHIISATNGKEALQKLEQHPDISLIITDYNMPEMNGLQLIEAVRENYKREELAIIGLSRSDNTELTVQLLKLGANDYMTKPFIPEEFYCRVSQSVNFISHLRTIKESASKDFLTKVYNRASLFELGESLFANARRGDIQIAVAMIDADHFKSINDNYGHDTGDRVLIALANCLKSSLRTSDIVARFGGEEFTTIIVIKKPQEAEQVFEKLREAIASMKIPLPDNEISVTVSIGATTTIGSSLEEMIKLADTAVYQSKEQGRNRVTIL